MSPLENWTWVLAEARASVSEPCRAPMIAIRAYEVWALFIAKRA